MRFLQNPKNTPTPYSNNCAPCVGPAWKLCSSARFVAFLGHQLSGLGFRVEGLVEIRSQGCDLGFVVWSGARRDFPKP